MKIYISGAITGRPIEDVRKQFDTAEDEWLAKGYEVVNPIHLCHKDNSKWEDYMRNDLINMLLCDSIYMLEGWYKSKGATLEHHIAKKLKFKVIYQGLVINSKKP